MSITQRYFCYQGSIKNKSELAASIPQPELMRLACYIRRFEVRKTCTNGQPKWCFSITAAGCDEATSSMLGVPFFTVDDWATSEEDFLLMRRRLNMLMAQQNQVVVESENFSLVDGQLALVRPTYRVFATEAGDGCDNTLPLAMEEQPPATRKPETERTGLNSNLTFGNFVVCESNQMTAAAARYVAEKPGEQGYSPLVVQGGRGVGKTHLLHAIGNAFVAEHPEAKVVCLTAEEFVTGFVRALRNKRLDDYRQHLHSAQLLLVDDAQFLANKGASQEEMARVIDTLVNNNRQVVLAIDRFLPRLDQLDNDFKRNARKWLTGQLNMPELEARVAILQQLAKGTQVSLPDKAATLIAERADGDMHELLRVMKLVLAQARFLQQSISIKLVNQAMKEY